MGDNFEAKVRKKLANNNTDIELLELDLVLPASGLTEHKEGEQLLLRINDVSIEPPRISVKVLTKGTNTEIHRIG